jgi:hypothetical protein
LEKAGQPPTTVQPIFAADIDAMTGIQWFHFDALAPLRPNNVIVAIPYDNPCENSAFLLS